MKTLKKKYLIIISIILIVVIAIASLFIIPVDNITEINKNDLYISKHTYKAISSKNKQEISNADEMRKIQENDNYYLEINTVKKMFCVSDKKSGVAWLSGQNATNEIIPRNRNIMQNIMSISYLENEDSTEVNTLTASSDDVSAKFYTITGGFEAVFDFEITGISVTMQIILDDTGFYAVIPDNGIKENGDGRIVSLDLLPAFGSKFGDTNSCFLYPDGCGALYECTENEANGELYSANVYMENHLNLDVFNSKNSDSQKSIVWPYYGSYDDQQGMIAYIVSGSETSRIIFSEGLATFPLNRIYASRDVRQVITQVGMKGERDAYQNNTINDEWCIKYSLLNKKEASYSGMANSLRDFLQSIGILPESTNNDATLALDIFMGTKYSTLLGESDMVLTNYKEAKKILQDLSKSSVRGYNAYLLGWQEDGYGALPIKAEYSASLGSKSDLVSLLELNNGKDKNVFLQTDYVFAKDGGEFSIQSDVVNNFANEVVTNKDETLFLLNPYRMFLKFKNDDMKKFENLKATALSFDSMCKTIPADYNSNRKLSFKEATNAFRSLLMLNKKSGNVTAVQGGNDYLIDFADTIYDLPDKNSNLLIFNKSIPFLQMVLHGVIPFSCETPGNMASDFEILKLKWAEYGAIPYFIITESSSSSFTDTKINDVFSTCYDEWKDLIIETAIKFQNDFKNLKYQNIVAHNYISDTFVSTEYEDGTKVIINYGNETVEFEDIRIAAKSYEIILKKG